MEKEKAELAITIQGQKQELQKLATVKTEIKSVEKISTGKTILGGKVTVDEKDYKKLTSLAKKQLAKESNEKKLSNEVSLLQKENKELQAINANLSAQLQKEKSMSHRLSMKSLQAEIYELRRFKQKAEEFMNRFISQNGTVVCRELLGYDISKPEEMDKIKELNLFESTCPKMIQCATEIVEQMLNEE